MIRRSFQSNSNRIDELISLVFAAAASHILSSRSQPFSRRAAAAASHICVTAATPYFLANYNFHERKR
jgi:tRNA(His) 5'-end guanylyltransferase